MEKYFIIRNKKIKKDYDDWLSEREKFVEAYRFYSNQIDIESTLFCPCIDRLCIRPTDNDKMKFKDHMLKSEIGKFKKTSWHNQEWVSLLKQRGITGRIKPTPGLYVDNLCGKFLSSMFEYAGNLYGHIDAEMDFKSPKFFHTIEASKYHLALERLNELQHMTKLFK